MPTTIPADNATRPCSRCRKPRGHMTSSKFCRPCANAYVREWRAKRAGKADVGEVAEVRVPRELRVGATPGADCFWLRTW